MRPGPEQRPQRQQPARGIEGGGRIFGPQIPQEGQSKTAPENGQHNTRQAIEKARDFAYQRSVEDVNARFLRERMGY